MVHMKIEEKTAKSLPPKWHMSKSESKKLDADYYGNNFFFFQANMGHEYAELSRSVAHAVASHAADKVSVVHKCRLCD